MFHGVTGMVFDMGTVAGDRTSAVCCGKESFFAAVNGPDGGMIASAKLQPLPFDLIQEWHIARTPFDIVPSPVPGEQIVHAVSDSNRITAAGVTSGALFSFDFASGRAEVIGNAPGRGRCAVFGNNIIGPDDENTLWVYEPATKALSRKSIPLPDAEWNRELIWARDPVNGLLYTADAQGGIHALDKGGTWRVMSGRIPHVPATAMAVTLDGRIFGSCGTDMQRLFCCGPEGSVTDIGVAVSTLERRRYGYSFADAAMGRDGEIIFAENDDLGHLWLYFPRIQHVKD
jgi:hypothetical protein